MTVAYTYKGIGYEIDYDAAWDYIRDGYLLPPRTILKGRTKLPPAVLPDVSVDLDNIVFIVEQTLKNLIGHVAGTRRAVMFSGGFDSILIALLTQHCGAQVTAVTVQFDNFNLRTVTSSIQMATKIGIAHHILRVTGLEFLSAFKTLAGITNEPLLDLDLAVVYAALKKYDHSVAGDVFITGMGSDESFGDEALEARPGGLAARMNFQILDENAHQLVAQAHQCKFVFPFLSESMLTLSQQIPSSMKQDKKLLRALAVTNMIPHRGARSEVTQVPSLMRDILVKVYGDRAWPKPITGKSNRRSVDDKVLRQIVLGLWFEKLKDRVKGL